MMPKSGYRFSENIMLQEEVKAGVGAGFPPAMPLYELIVWLDAWLGDGRSEKIMLKQ